MHAAASNQDVFVLLLLKLADSIDHIFTDQGETPPGKCSLLSSGNYIYTDTVQ
jgi:hypothetical protein